MLSRITLVGERRRIDLVLPSQEPIGLLLPEVMRLLDDRGGERPQARHLVTADGSALEQDATLESAGVPDGAVLRLVRIEHAPSAPVVHDVSDEAADDLDVRAWRWGARARRIVSAGACVAWAVAASFIARDGYEARTVGSALAIAAAVAAVAGVLLGRSGRKGLATALIGASAAVGIVAAWSFGDANGWSAAVRWGAVAAVMIVALLLFGGSLRSDAVPWSAPVLWPGSGRAGRSRSPCSRAASRPSVPLVLRRCSAWFRWWPREYCHGLR